MQVTKRVEFDSAHRLYGYTGPCARFHGHRYVLEVTLTGPDLDDLGMLVDFKEVSQQANGWVQEKWDHRAILSYKDPLREVVEDCYVMHLGRNPTAENMLLEFSDAWKNIKGTKLYSLRLYETPDCWADLIL